MIAVKDTIEIPCNIKHETDKALLIQAFSEDEDDEVSVWIPLSQVEKITRGIVGNEYSCSVVMSKWIAQTKGID